MDAPLKLPGSRFSASVYRIVRTGFDPLSAAGSVKVGGRYNPEGEFGALYLSTEEAAAVAEVLKGLRVRGIDAASFPVGEWWTYEIEIEVDQVLDLTDPVVLTELGLRADSLIGSDRSLTQRIAAEARDRGYRGLLAPSAALPGRVNLIVFSSDDPPRTKVLASKATTFEPT